MKINKIIEKVMAAPITEADYNVAAEFEKLAKQYKSATISFHDIFVRAYKELLNKIDALEDNKKKMELVKKFETDALAAHKHLTDNLLSGLDSVTAHLP